MGTRLLRTWCFLQLVQARQNEQILLIAQYISRRVHVSRGNDDIRNLVKDFKILKITLENLWGLNRPIKKRHI